MMNAEIQTNQNSTMIKTETAVMGGGCFWCLEALLQTVDGVVKVTSGYAGGKVPNPTYEQVCAGDTGHAEVIQIEFNPDRLTYPKLLELFWKAHDPTTLNRQGPDTGTQYRSIILYSNEEQKKLAEKSKTEAARHFKSPIVTQIVALEKFYPAETYHQNYYRNNPNAGYCRMVIQPKLSKFQN
jgi:peptide-methionine (S)-S-oxide reductase